MRTRTSHLLAPRELDVLNFLFSLAQRDRHRRVHELREKCRVVPFARFGIRNGGQPVLARRQISKRELAVRAGTR